MADSQTPVPTVLVVDDEKNYLLVMATLLTDQGYEVLTTERAEDALRMVRTSHVDLMLTDMKMPKMDASNCCARPRTSGRNCRWS
jgi:two-component system NtrC family response regulator